MQLLEGQSGEEVMEALTRRAKEAGITNGAILSLIGAVESATISNMAADNALQDNIRTYDQPCELLGTGAITDGKVHIHVTLGREGDVALAGHLHAAQVETFFVRAWVEPCSASSPESDQVTAVEQGHHPPPQPH
jgi:uncharacterized protein